ncbi:MAG: hypothetical protein DMG68_21450, partial [Acidobacteria bacterium]
EQSEGGGPNYSIYVRKTDGSPAVRLGDNDAFSISDDGKWILATTNAEGGSLLLIPTGAGEARTIKTGDLRDTVARFLPDQHRILVLAPDGRVYVQSLDSDTPRAVTPPGVNAYSVSFTADGKYVLGQDQQQNSVALYPIEGGQPIPLPKWTAGDEPV